MLLYWYPKCSTCQRAKAWLDQRGIFPETRDVKLQGPTAGEVEALWRQSGLPLKKLFNTSGLRYKALELKDRLPHMDQEEQLALLGSDGMLVKRPILAGEGFVLVGFREAEWTEKLG